MADLLNTIAPEFDDHPARATWIEIASSRVNTECFGAVQTPMAIAFLAAHWMTLFPASSTLGPSDFKGAGPATMHKEGDVSIGYRALVDKVSTVGDAAYTETAWGRQYLNLRASRACTTARVVTPG